jgi:glycosyltransferase involved in cell wall biosynthesis
VILANSAGVSQKCREFEDWVGEFTPGVDPTMFYPDASAKTTPPRVVFYGRPGNERNGFSLGIEALRRVKHQLGSGVDLVSVGGVYPERSYDLEGVVRNAGVLASMEAVAELYRTSEVGVVFMFTAHPSYQPLEFMASGCATVTNYNPSNNWLLRDGENCVLTPSTVSSVANTICALVEDEQRRHRVVAEGLTTAASLRWEDAWEAISDFLVAPQSACVPPT